MLRQYIAIQLVPSDCSMWPPVGQGRAPIEDADVVEPEKSALKDVVPLFVFAVHPPGEIEHQLVEDPFEERAIADPAALLLNLVDAQRRPCVHRWIHVAESPFVGGNLPVGVHVPFAQHQESCSLAKSASTSARGKQ